jgi:hypothetical protein
MKVQLENQLSPARNSESFIFWRAPLMQCILKTAASTRDRRHHCIALGGLLLSMFCLSDSLDAQEKNAPWQLPSARDVELGGPLGEAYRQGVARLAEDPYRSVVYLRSDLSFEMERSFTNYSGDISGRFMEIACLTSPPGRLSPPPLPELL